MNYSSTQIVQSVMPRQTFSRLKILVTNQERNFKGLTHLESSNKVTSDLLCNRNHDRCLKYTITWLIDNYARVISLQVKSFWEARWQDDRKDEEELSFSALACLQERKFYVTKRQKQRTKVHPKSS